LDISTWHPLTVHFPIAFLSLSSIIGIYLIFKPNKVLSQYNLGLLFLGCLGLLISIYTGNDEESKVARVICDPTELKTHENFAYYTLYAYAVYLASGLILLKTKQGILKQLLYVLIVLSSLTGLSTLVYVGHLGASIVYNQAGGVSVPDKDCSGF